MSPWFFVGDEEATAERTTDRTQRGEKNSKRERQRQRERETDRQRERESERDKETSVTTPWRPDPDSECVRQSEQKMTSVCGDAVMRKCLECR